MTGKTRQFRFKPAPVSAARSYAMNGDILSIGGGGEKQVDLTGVTNAAFVRHRFRRQVMLRLDLTYGDRTERISYSGTAAGWKSDPDAHQFIALCSAVCTGLDRLQPGFPVTFGEHGRPRLIMFGIGLVSILGGLGLFAAALATGVAGPKLIAGAIPMLALTALGVIVALAYAPWRQIPRLPAAAMPELLAQMIAPSANRPAT